MGRRVGRWGVAAFVVAACAFSGTASQGARVEAAPGVATVEYQGTIDETKAVGAPGDKWAFHVQWDYVYRIYPPLTHATWRIKSLSGTVSATLAAPNNSSSCSGKLSDDPYLHALSALQSPDSEIGKPDVFQVSGFAPTILLSSAPHTPFNFCGNESHDEIYWDSPSPQPKPDPFEPYFDYKLGSGAQTKKFNYTWDSKDQVAEHLVLASTLSVNAAASPSPPTTAQQPATPQPVRDAALAALKGELNQAVWPCLSAASGVGLAGLGGPVGVVVGGTLAGVGGTVCAEIVAAINNLRLTYNDPPNADYKTAATISRAKSAPISLPTCPTGSLAAACARQHAAALAWAAAVQRVEESSAAMATTAGRESSARSASDTSALALQIRTATRLLPSLQADLDAQAKAGTALATALASTPVKLTAAQSSKAIATLLSRLSALGALRPELTTDVPGAFSPQPENVAATLRQHP